MWRLSFMNKELEMIENFEPNAKTDRTRKNINKKLSAHLQKTYGRSDITNEILKAQGIDARQFDIVGKIENIYLNHVKESSIDDNANKESIHTEATMQEAFNPIRKLVGYDLLYRQMKGNYGQDKADELSMSLYDYSLAIHDSTKIDRVYCWALPTTFLITEGRNMGALPSTPTKRLDSYIAGTCEVVHQLSNHLAGAVAVSSLFIDVAAILMCKKGILGNPVPLTELKNNPLIRKLVENEFQQFVHSVNSLTRCAIESPFTNVTVSDEIKLRKIAEDYQWLFEKEGGSDFYSVDEIVEYTIEVQKIFIAFFDKGIPLRGGMQIRFPVVTCGLSKDKKGNLVETNWFDWMAENTDITRYNMFMSSGSKTCSCCRLINDDELLSYGSSVSSLANTSMAMGSIRVVTLNFPRLALMATSIEDFYNRLDKLTLDCAMILKSHRDLIATLEKAGLQPFITNGTLKMNRLFSTFGVIGLSECVGFIEEKFGKQTDFMGEMLVHFKEKCKEYAKELKFPFNIEQVPGESMAPRLAYVDSVIFGKQKQPHPIYSNQFIPLWAEGDVIDRLEMDGKYQIMLTGGGIVHLTCSEQLTPTQNKKIIRTAASLGNEHFAINPTRSICENGHYKLGRLKSCPECGGKIVDYMYRTVGFPVLESHMNIVRRTWEATRRVSLSIINTFKD